MSDRDSFAALMERLRSGEDAAAREVFERFARQLIALARHRFDQRLAHRVDPEDVVQSAFKSFFVRHREGKLRLDNWNGLWSLLSLITLRKCADRVEYLRAERRDVGREVSAPLGQDQPWELALDREPLPEEAAVLAETVEGLFRAVDDDERPVLELSLKGYTAAEIGLKLGRALRTVQRLREQIRKRLERDAADGLRAAGG
jgi:RNA polymerase sigma factor (sigma-70 family)